MQRAELLGGRAFAIRAWLKPERMAALEISPSQVRQALAANNYLSAIGETKGTYIQTTLTASTDLKSVEQFKRLVVKTKGDTIVRLSDIADVVLGAETYEQDVRMSGQRAVFMGVWVLPNANSLDVIKGVRAELEQIQKELPSGMQASVAYDSSTYIQDAIHEVRNTLLETIAIVVVVIFLFLGSARTVGVPVVAIPVSLVGAVFLMQAMGFTLNLLTLLAIVLSVGLVVDDAIVVVENVERHIRLGESKREAAIKGARELVLPIIAMTVTLAAVFAPIGFQGGLTGALFREFAFTLAGAVVISGVVALTLSPMMCSRFLRDHPGRDQPPKRGWLVTRIDRTFEAIRDRYARALGRTLRARRAVYAVWIALSLAVIPLYVFSFTELAPTKDRGIVFGAVDPPANATLEQMVGYTNQIEKHFESIPEFDSSFQITFPNAAFGGMVVKPWSERSRSIHEIHEDISAKTATIAGARVPMFVPPSLPNPGLLPIEIVVASTASHEEILRETGTLVDEAMKRGLFAFPPIIDVKIDQATSQIVLDRDKIASMGLEMGTVGADLAAMIGGRFVNRFNIEGRSYKVIAQIERAGRLTPGQLEDIRVTGPGGHLVPLGAIAHLEDNVEPRTLNRFQQLNAVKISGAPMGSLDEGLRKIEQLAAEKLPANYRVDHTGESRQLRQEGGKFLPAMGLAILLIFLVLAAQFNSFRDPLVILAGSVPLAMFGALVFVFLKFSGPPGMRFGLTEGWTTTLNIYSQIGLVTLVGLVAKNGILIVEFANVQQRAGLPKLDAALEGAKTRLRPILMTTVATVAGHFPLTLVSGPGAAARNAIGVVLVGGLAIGTLFTLFVVPSLYVLIARDHQHEREEESAGDGRSTLEPSPAE